MYRYRVIVRRQYHRLRRRLRQSRFVSKNVAAGTLAGLLAIFIIAGQVQANLQSGGSNQATLASSSISLQKGLVGWWKMDGNARDSSPYGGDGIITGATPSADRKGIAGSAYNFVAASSQEISVPDSTPLSPTSKLTVSTWFRGTSNTALTGIVSKDISGSVTNPAYSIMLNNGVVSFSTTNAANASQRTISKGGIVDAQWYHVVGTYDGTTMTFYLNGVSVGTISQTDIADTSGRLRLGQQKSGTNRYFNGDIDDVRIYTRDLSAPEVRAMYEQYGAAVKAASGSQGLIGWWKLDGNGRDSSPYGSSSTSTNVTPVSDRKGQAGGAMSFDGSSSLIDVAAGSNYNPGSLMTVSFWINGSLGASSGGRYVLARLDTNAANNPVYGCYAQNSRVYCDFKNATNTATVPTSGSALLSDNTWYHVAMTYDGTTSTQPLRSYVNGVQSIAQGSGNTYGAIVTSSANLRIGAQKNGNPGRTFSGAIDDVRVYNRVLTAPEIKALAEGYNSGVLAGGSGQAGSVSLGKGLVGQWAMDGNARDASPYGNNGTVSGATLAPDRKGRAGSAYAFNGSSNYVGLPNGAAIAGNGAYTMSAWIKTSTLNAGGIIGWGNYSGDVQSNALRLDSGGGIRSYWYAAGTSNADLYASYPTIANGVWHLVTATANGTVRAIYVDGVLIASDAPPAHDAVAANVSIGRTNTSGEYFNGSIDDVRLYNRALNAGEVKALYEGYN